MSPSFGSPAMVLIWWCNQYTMINRGVGGRGWKQNKTQQNTAEKNQIKIFVSEHGVCLVGSRKRKPRWSQSVVIPLSFPDVDTGTQWGIHRKSVGYNVSLLNINFCTCSQCVLCILLRAWRRGEGECYKQSQPVCHGAVLLLTWWQ